MKITSPSEALTALTPMDPTHFTGNAGSRELIQASPQTLSTFAAVVRFEAGARNHWHSHAGGQLLHVIEGEGWVQSRGHAPTHPAAGHRNGRSRRGALARRQPPRT